MTSKLATVALAGAALATTAAQGPTRAADPVASALPAIRAANADWLPAMEARSAERLAEPYAPDAVFVLRDGRSAVGHDAIVALYRDRLAKLSRVVAGGITRDGVARGGDGLVYEWGHGGMTAEDAQGRTTTSQGPYLTVWRREPSGRWRIIRNLVF